MEVHMATNLEVTRETLAFLKEQLDKLSDWIDVVLEWPETQVETKVQTKVQTEDLEKI